MENDPKFEPSREEFVDKEYNQFPQEKEGFYWIPLLGILLPIIVFLSYAFPALDASQPLYMDAAGNLVGKKNFYDLVFSSTVATILFTILIIACLALCVPLVLASFSKKFRGYKLFNALFTPSLALAALLALILPIVIIYQIQQADLAYRAANDITTTVGASTYLFLGTLYLFIPMLSPTFVLIWWLFANAIAYSKAKKAAEEEEENEIESGNDIVNEEKEAEEDEKEHPRS